MGIDQLTQILFSKMKFHKPKQKKEIKKGIEKLKYHRKSIPVVQTKLENNEIKSHQNVDKIMENRKEYSQLQNKFAKKLQGSRFRIINENIYTKRGEESFREFTNNPILFEIYHTGFREQASQWPENPLDGIIKWIQKCDKNLMIADMGCGDAKLAKSVEQKVFSFDFVSTSPEVIAADIAHVPLDNESVDIVVFCLSLMGTNIGDFILEAHRILKSSGIMKIIEVRSRFEKGKDDIKKFIRIVKRAGFEMTTNQSVINKMFFTLECRKTKKSVSHPENIVFSAQPCVYKKR